MTIQTPSLWHRLQHGWRVVRHGYPTTSPWQMSHLLGGFEGKAAPFVWPDWKIGTPQWQLINYEGYVEEGFNLNGLIYSAIMYKVRAMTAAPLRAYTGDRDNPEPLDADAPLSKLLDRPNPSSSWSEFHGSSVVYFNIAGNCYVLLDRPGGEGLPEAMYTLRPDRVLIVPLKQGRGRGTYTVGFVYVPEGKNAWMTWSKEQRMDAMRRDDSGVLLIPGEDLMHVKLPNPGDPLEGMGYGLSPISPLARSADVDNAITNFLKLFFDKGVTVPGILSTDQPLDDSTIATLKERWKEMYGGYRRWAEEIGVLDYGMEYQRIGLDFDEMVFSDLDERNESRILGPFGVPPILIGSRLGLMRSTYSNYQEARQAFWDDTMVPETRLFEADYRYYLQDRDGRDFVAFDFSQVPIYKEAALAARQQAFAEFQAGARTLNEFRQIAQLEEDPAGDYYLRPLTLMPVPFGQQPEAPAPEPASAGGAEGAEQPPSEEPQPEPEPPAPQPDATEEGAAEAESDQREEGKGTKAARSFAIPETVQDAARQALAWREEYGRGGTDVGLATARLLARGGSVGAEKVRHIARYFPRHEVDKEAEGWSPGEDGYPSNGRIAWGLWGGDAGRSWANRLVAQMDREEEGSKEGPFDEAPAHHKSAFSPEAKQRLWQQQDATAVAWEPRFAEAGQRAFENDRRAILAALTAAQRKAYERKQTVDWDAVGQVWLDYLANEAPANWWGEFEPAVRGLMETQGRMWAGLLGQEWNAAWLAGEWFDAYKLQFSQPILETTELDLSALLKQAVREGWSIPQMQKAIEALFQRYVSTQPLTDTERAWFEERLPQYRLENISRTESLTAGNLGSFIAFAGLGATHKEWLDTPDTRTREDHRDAGARYRVGGNPGPIPLAQPFIVGGEELMFPGDPKASPEQRCQCRCALLPWSPALGRVL